MSVASLTGSRTGRLELRGLTGLRGIAAVWVLLGHYKPYHGSGTTSFLQSVVDHKGLAVDLFFLLSGFVLAMVYGEADGYGRPWVGMTDFLRARLARIYPFYLLMTLICFSLAAANLFHLRDTPATSAILAANLLMIQSWVPHIGSLDGPSWSISTEWAANLLFPILAFAFLRSSKAVASLSMAALFGLVVCLAYLTGGLFRDHILLGSTHLIPQFTQLSIVRTVAEFSMGMLLWRASLDATLMKVLSRNDITIFACICLSILSGFPATDVLSIALFMVLILGLAREDNLVARLLGSPVPRWLGLISYSLYLCHSPLELVSDQIKFQLIGYHIAHARPISMVIRLMLPFAVAWTTYRLIERPGQKLLLRLLPRRILAPQPTSRA